MQKTSILENYKTNLNEKALKMCQIETHENSLLLVLEKNGQSECQPTTAADGQQGLQP